MTYSDLKTLIESTLSIPVYTDAMSITYPSATIECYKRIPRLFGEGKAKARVDVYQIDIWYLTREDRDAAQALLESALDSSNVTGADIESYYDTTAHKFRATFHFETL